MSAGDEIMMPVAKPEAVSMAEIHALRQISDALTATNQSLQNLAHDVREVRTDVKEVREKVIRMEGEDLKAQLRETRKELRDLAKDVNDLQTVRDRQAGALSVGGWIAKYAPWLVAIFMAGLAGLGIKTGASG
ncbi:hypothetical protein [Brevundimonas sp.]|uniref:hypothetical protein n=1 Tax=Brevundimonas sp. TaxID=1871086 RepID=UPI002D61881D|nr:hypothetical protein [Brevundimonas sp.]HYC66632.1 hypothetical protein [Brevundimonas sp.]